MSEGLIFAHLFGGPQTVGLPLPVPLGPGIVHVGILSHWIVLLVGYLHRTEPLVTDVLVNRFDNIYAHTGMNLSGVCS